MIPDFRDLLAAFASGGVRFLVVGAHALAAHGIPRATGDLDLWIDTSRENAVRTWDALAAFGAPLEALGVAVADFAGPDRVIQLGLPPYRIDILTSISGVSFEQAWTGRLEGTLFEVAVGFIGREDLLKNKRASGRPKDLEDLRSLGG